MNIWAQMNKVKKCVLQQIKEMVLKIQRPNSSKKGTRQMATRINKGGALQSQITTKQDDV